MINPALHRHPTEAALIGALVVGYSELDISMVDAAGYAIGLRFPLLDAVEAVSSELVRIEVVRRMSQHHFRQIRLNDQFQYAVAAQMFCREVRNHYAHCHYADFGENSPLVAVKARHLFGDHGMTVQQMPWKEVSIELLTQQEAYFEHARKWWLWLSHAAARLTDSHQPEVNEPPTMEQPEKLGADYRPP